MATIAADLVVKYSSTGAAKVSAEMKAIGDQANATGRQLGPSGLSGETAKADAALAGTGAAAGTAEGEIAAVGATAGAASGEVAAVGGAAAVAEGDIAAVGSSAAGAEAGIAGAGAAAGTAEPLVADLGGAAAVTAGSMGDTEKAARGADKEIGKVGGSSTVASVAVAGVGLAMLGAMLAAVDMAAKFDYAAATTKAKLEVIGGASKITGSDMDAMRNKALALGRDTVFSATDAMNAMVGFARAGRPIKEIVDNDAQAALNLAGAVDASVPDATNIIANMMNVWGLKGKDAEKVANDLAVATLKSGKSLNEMATAMGQAANIARTLGIPLSDAAAAVADIARNGVVASTAGASLKTALDHLLNPSKAAAAIMQEYNIHLTDAQGNFVGLANLADQLHAAFGNLTGAEQQQIAHTLGLYRGEQVLAIWMREGGSAIRENAAAMNNGNAAAEIMAIKMDTLTGSLHQLKGSIDTVAVIIGESLTPYVRDLADGLTRLANDFINLSPHTQDLIGKGLALAAAFLALSGGIGVVAKLTGPLVDGLQAVAGPLLELGPYGIAAAAAVGLFALAWKENWLNIQPAVKQGLVDLAPALQSAQTGVQDFAKQVGDQGLGAALRSINWSSIAANFAQGGMQMIDSLEQSIRNNWPKIQSTIYDQSSHIGEYFGEAIGLMLGVGAKLIAGVVVGLVAHWREIPGFLFNAFVRLPIDILLMVVTAFVGVGVGIVTGINKGLNQAFPGAESTAKTWLNGLPSKLGNAALVLLPTGVALVAGLIQGWTQKIGEFGVALVVLGRWVHDTIGDTIGTLTDRGHDLMQGLMDAWTEQSNTFMGWLNDFGQWAYNQLYDTNTLFIRGFELMQGLMNAWKEQSNVLQGWANDFGQWIYGQLYDTGTLFIRGWELIQGLMQGWSGASAFLQAYANGLGSWIAAQVGDLSGVLYNAGYNIVWGMIPGMEAAAGSAVSAVKNVVGSIVQGALSAAGIHSPSTVFLGIGQNLVDAMALGIAGGAPGAASAMTAAVGGVVGAGSAGSFGGFPTAGLGSGGGGGFGPTVHGGITVNVTTSAQDGRGIGRDIARELSRQLGFSRPGLG